MRLGIVVFLTTALFLTSCGSKKRVVSSQPKKVVIKTEKTKTPQISPISKTKKTTVNNTQEYIEKYAPIAVKKMNQYRIPASITLAQGILESGSGRSDLAVRSNNHFGIKCHKGWQGKSVTHDDDAIGECFRKYQYPEQSYDDHSKFLLGRKRYANLFKLRPTDYRGWAYGLKKAGYATDKKYPAKLIALIKKYNLDKYDRMKPVKNTPTRGYTNDYHKVVKGDTLYSISKKYNTTVAHLKEVNGLKSNDISIGQHILIK